MTKLNNEHKTRIEKLREDCYNSLWKFAHTVVPYAVWGECHRELFEFWQKAEVSGINNTLVLMPREHRKALEVNEKIKTTDGWITCGEAQPGQEILGYDGLPQIITHAHPISEMDLWEVVLDDGRKVKCNSEHLWTVECPSNWGAGVLKTVPLKTILKNYTEWRYFIYPPEPLSYPERDLPVDPYTLGIWLGAGASCRGEITTGDEEVFNHIPDEYLHASLAQRMELLRGLLDSGDCLHVKNKNLAFTTTREELKDGVCNLVRSLGGKAKVSDAGNASNPRSYLINIWLPDDVITSKLERKLARWQKGQRLKSTIKEINYIGKAKARCITVSNKDGIFLTNDYIPTHNSFSLAVRCCWEIYKNPAITIIYVSATTELAERQLLEIKNILISQPFRILSPDMVNKNENDRRMWNNNAIMVDHARRAAEGVRDPTVCVAGLSTNTTGWHCNFLAKDDVVVPENAYTGSARRKVEAACSQLASVLTTNGTECAVGTRYHPEDHYNTLINMFEDIRDEETGDLISEKKVFAVHERQVEENGVFLWPRQRRKSDNKMFGFNWAELERKKAKYVDRIHFYCFHPDTLVYTDGGHKRIEDLVPGIDSFNGNLVKNLFEREQDNEAVELCVCGVPVNIISTKGHTFPVRVKTYKTDYGVREMQLGDIQKNTVITKRYYLGHKFPTEILDNRFDEDDWWLIGHYLAEGNKWDNGRTVRYIVLTTSKDEEKGIHTKLREIISRKGLHHLETDTKHNTKVFSIVYDELFDYLDEFGYYCHGKHLNYDAKRLDSKKSKSLVDGYLAGDGYSLKQGGYGITSVSLRLLEDIKDVLLRLGETPYIFKLYDEGSRKSFGYDVRTCYTIRWTPESKRPKNFIEDGVYWQLLKAVVDSEYVGKVITCEVEDIHKYNVMGLECKNSQYYNNPNDLENRKMNRANFNYYKKEHIVRKNNSWYYNERKLNVYAAMDFAFSKRHQADYSCILVFGIDWEFNIYVLDIARFKTDTANVYFTHLKDLLLKWEFSQLRAEVTAAQDVIVNSLKDMIQEEGFHVHIEKYRPLVKHGSKEERIDAALLPRYESGKIYHYKGGDCTTLEEELLLDNPPHDDVKDTFAAGISAKFISKPRRPQNDDDASNLYNALSSHRRFGGSY